MKTKCKSKPDLEVLDNAVLWENQPPHLLESFRRMLLCHFAVKLPKCFINYDKFYPTFRQQEGDYIMSKSSCSLNMLQNGKKNLSKCM